jgi:hypothetical protein
MKQSIQRKNESSLKSTSKDGPSLYEMEYLQQLASELQTFLSSRTVCTVNDISLGFQGDNYSGQMLISRGA